MKANSVLQPDNQNSRQNVQPVASEGKHGIDAKGEKVPKAANVTPYKMSVNMAEFKQEVSLSDIFMAKMRIKTFSQATPCAKTHFEVDFETEVTLKEENLLPTGSYFDRAVLNSLLVLPEDQRRRGVITATECRPFIRALFHYGPKVGVPVTVVVPNGSEIQRQTWSQPGKIIVSCGDDIKEAKKYAKELAQGVRLEYLDSDHSLTILAGLGTQGFEILEQCGCTFEAILAPGNDNNLLTALRCSVKRIFPHVQIIGVAVPNEELTSGAVFSFPDTGNTSDGVSHVSNADVSKAVVRVLEEKGVLLSKQGATGLASVMSAHLNQLPDQLHRVVVVSSERLVPCLLQIEKLLNEGLAA